MRYLFFDTAVNGYYTLTVLKKELASFLPLIRKEENISDDAAPFLFEVNDEKLAQFLSTEHISFKDILFLESNETLAAIQTYFSRFVVQTINGREFYFRFWSATVFKKYIATCNMKQLADFFKIVQTFICEEDNGSVIQFSFDGKQLKKEGISAVHLFSDLGIISSQETSFPASGNSKPENNIHQKKKPARKFFSD